MRGLLLLSLAVGAWSTSSAAVAGSAAARRPAPTLAANQRAAHREAARLLAALRLPAGASLSPVRPHGDNGWLKPSPGLVATNSRADAYRWWRVAGTPAAVLAYVTAHRPRGSTLLSAGTGSRGQSSVDMAAFSWPAIPGVIGFRELSVSGTALAGGGTGVLAQSETVWIVPRPPAEQVPAGAHEIDITSARPYGPATLSLSVTSVTSVTSVSEVRRITSLFNSMPIVQPAAYSCPALTAAGARVLTFRFRTRAEGALLATARYVDYAPLGASSGPCNPIDFSVRGHRQPALIGGGLVTGVQRILHASLTGDS